MGTKKSDTRTHEWVQNNATPFTPEMVHDWLTDYLVNTKSWVGHSATLMITGASGSGKTRMLSTVAKAIQSFMGRGAATWTIEIPHNGMKKVTIVEPSANSRHDEFIAVLFDLDVFGRAVDGKWIVDAKDMEANLALVFHRLQSMLAVSAITQVVLVAAGTSDNFWQLALTEPALWPEERGMNFPPTFWYLLPSPDLFRAANRAKAEESLWMDIPSRWRQEWFANSELSYDACLAKLTAKAMRAKEQYLQYKPREMRVDPEYKTVFVRKDGDVAYGWHRDENGTERGGQNG